MVPKGWWEVTEGGDGVDVFIFLLFLVKTQTHQHFLLKFITVSILIYFTIIIDPL